MRVGSLCSGIGGLDLGLERAGMTVVWQSETDPFACKVLGRHWPDVPNLGDLTTIDWATVDPVDLICAGYPCQPFSLAGSREGTDDPRHLWPHIASALRILRPEWALLENVPGHLSLGFGEVLADLAALGFDADWDCIPAAFVGAPHLRYRIFVVAHSSGPGRRQDSGGTSADETEDEGRAAQHDHLTVGHGQGHPARAVADTDSAWQHESSGGLSQVGRRAQDSSHAPGGRALANTDSAPRGSAGSTSEAVSRPQEVQRSGRRGGSDRDHWESEPDVGRVAHGVPSRLDRLRCLGNAVVPQVAELVGRQIMRAAA